MGLVTISAHSSRELIAVIAALQAAPREWQKVIRTETRTVAAKEWTAAVNRHAAAGAHSATASAVLAKTARVKVSNQNVSLTSATVGRRLRGGLVPAESWPGFEFGAHREAKTTYRATRNGHSFSVTRRTKAQLPARNRSGNVVYPAAAEVIPRIAALWAQTVARTIHEALEAGSRG